MNSKSNRSRLNGEKERETSKKWRQVNFFRTLILIAMCFILFSNQANAGNDVRDSIVKIYSVKSFPDYDQPWNVRTPVLTNASGCIIEGNRILTNAHAVSYSTFIEVQRHGQVRKYPARVLVIAHDADLALLIVDDPAFFENVTPLDIGELTEVQQEVLVYGFPQGGDMLSATRGVVSRIEHTVYQYSSRYLLAAQIDAAVNPGSSGGPAMAGDKIVGVVMQAMRGAENTGYIIPTPIIRHFFKDLEDGRYDGFPGAGFFWQPVENDGLRKMYGISDTQSGIIVRRLIPGSPAEGIMLPGDVVITVDGHNIADDGTVEIRRDVRTSLNYYIQQHQIGEKIPLEVLRNRKKETLWITLNVPMANLELVTMETGVQPTYFVYGGLVFSPLTLNYLFTWGNEWFDKGPKHLTVHLGSNRPGLKDEEVVVMSGILAAEVNKGYQKVNNMRVTEVNGKKILNLRDLIRVVEEPSDSPFVVFKDQDGTEVVLDRQKASETHAAILQAYRIQSDRSPNLQVPEKVNVSGESQSVVKRLF